MNLGYKNFTAGALALASFLIVTNATAGEFAAKSDGIAIRFSQEELNSSTDAENLYRKLKQASRKACGLDGGFLNLGEKTRAQKCYDETLAEIVHKIDRPLLTQLHDSKTSKVG
jgi:UrcA family protein